MRIVLAIDGSRSALRATEFVIRLVGGRADTEVHLINVQPPLRYADLISGKKKRRVRQWYLEGGESETAAACGMLAEAGVPCERHLVVGDPATAIVKLARKRDSDLIVMGSRGVGKVAGLFLGSVATKVMHLASTPVTVVK